MFRANKITTRSMQVKKANGQKHTSENERQSARHVNIADFLFDSSYQVVTWVLIALCIGAIFYYAGKDNGRGILWSGIGLLFSIILMIGIIADRRFFKSNHAAISTLARQAGTPHIFFKTTGLKV